MLKPTRRVLAIATLVMSAIALQSFTIHSFPTIPSAKGANRIIILVGFQLTGWNGTTTAPNPTISVNQGDVITAQISSGDTLPHRFVVDVDKDGKVPLPACPPDKCSAIVPPSTTYPFNIDFAAGSYVYYCTYHPTSMFGTFTVQGTIVAGNAAEPNKLALLAPFIGQGAIILGAVVVIALYMRRAREKTQGE